MSIDSIDRDFPEIGGFPRKGICLPVTPRINRTKRLQKLIDHQLVQRLRGVRQLAFAHMIYPGAVHTRFEHSLGVVARAGQYLRVLSSDSQYPAFREGATNKEVSALLVASILHDIGHYPMAHSFEEMIPRGVPESTLKHDKIALRMLRGEMDGVITAVEIERLGNQLLEEWKISLPDVIAVLTGFPEPSMEINREYVPLLHSILDGPLDADKLDYLQRDSHHSGNRVARGIDEDRLLNSLLLRAPHEGLALRERGLAAAQSLYHARFSMFLTVYWHRTNRALARMFSEALTTFCNHDRAGFDEAFAGRMFFMDDERVLFYVGSKLNDVARRDLIEPLLLISQQQRHFYHRAVTISANYEAPPPRDGGRPEDPHSQICEMYDSYLRSDENRWRWGEFDREVRQRVMSIAAYDGLPHEVLPDLPDPRAEMSIRDEARDRYPSRKNEFLIYGKRSESPISIKHRLPIFGELLDSWRKNARKFRVFVSPELYGKLAGAEAELRKTIAQAAAQAYGLPDRTGKGAQ